MTTKKTFSLIITVLKFGDKMVKAADFQTSILAVISGGGYGKVMDLKSFLDATDKFLFQKMEKQ
jgi:hypothetical protein